MRTLVLKARLGMIELKSDSLQTLQKSFGRNLQTELSRVLYTPAKRSHVKDLVVLVSVQWNMDMLI